MKLLTVTFLTLSLSACADPQPAATLTGGSYFTTPALGVCADSPALALEKVTEVSVGSSVTFFDSGRGSELTSCLPTTFANGFNYVPLYAITFLNVRAGDVIQMQMETEATNDTGVNVMFAGLAALAPGFDISNSTALVTAANGYNVTPDMHHGMLYKVGQYQVDRDYARVNLVVFGYAATNGRGATSLTIEPNSGALTGFVYRR